MSQIWRPKHDSAMASLKYVIYLFIAVFEPNLRYCMYGITQWSGVSKLFQSSDWQKKKEKNSFPQIAIVSFFSFLKYTKCRYIKHKYVFANMHPHMGLWDTISVKCIRLWILFHIKIQQNHTKYKRIFLFAQNVFCVRVCTQSLLNSSYTPSFNTGTLKRFLKSTVVFFISKKTSKTELL